MITLLGFKFDPQCSNCCWRKFPQLAFRHVPSHRLHRRVVALQVVILKLTISNNAKIWLTSQGACSWNNKFPKCEASAEGGRQKPPGSRDHSKRSANANQGDIRGTTRSPSKTLRGPDASSGNRAPSRPDIFGVCGVEVASKKAVLAVGKALACKPAAELSSLG